jgi:hypothetical protein
MRRSASLVALVGLFAGCGGGSSSPQFQRAPGWHSLSRHGELVAASVQLAPADQSLASPPSRTVAALPHRGILIWVYAIRRRGGAIDAKFPPVPLRVERTVATNPPEGFFCAPAARRHCFEAGGSIRRMEASAAGWNLGVTIFFGRDRPSPAQIDAANAELARLSP